MAAILASHGIPSARAAAPAPRLQPAGPRRPSVCRARRAQPALALAAPQPGPVPRLGTSSTISKARLYQVVHLIESGLGALTSGGLQQLVRSVLLWVQRTLVMLGAALRAAADGRRSAARSAGADGSEARGEPPSPAHPPPPPLALLSAVTSGAATHLRQTLTDASATADSKWRALESSAAGALDSLFTATRESATALSELDDVPPAAATRLWHQESAPGVVVQEEALRRAVFAQVYAELVARDGRRPGAQAA